MPGGARALNLGTFLTFLCRPLQTDKECEMTKVVCATTANFLNIFFLELNTAIVYLASARV